eukprot:gene15993-18265_t
MLDYKPELYSLLVSAVQYGLRLHGNAWEGVPILDNVSQGGLPQFELARAYASAQVVLGSTMDAQSQYRMINNRIFEALACGALVVTKYSDELRDLGCNALLLTNQTHTLHTYMEQIRSMSREEVETLRQSARNLILSKHTWGHRAVQIIDFYHNLLTSGISSSTETKHTLYSEVCGRVMCLRANCPKLLWLVSPHLQQHQDYLQVARSMGRLHLCELYDITVMPSSIVALRASTAELQVYDYILSFVTPFDALDQAMRTLEMMSKPAAFGDAPILQKRACYLIGVDTQLIDAYLEQQTDPSSEQLALTFSHYDTVWYRDEFELALLTAICGPGGVIAAGRLQHVFGIGAVTSAESEMLVSTSGTSVASDVTATVVVCIYPHIHLCARSNREYFVRNVWKDDKIMSSEVYSYTLLLLGGSWDEWLSAGPGPDGQPFLNTNELHTVVHVRGDRVGDAANVVQRSRAVVILNPAYGDNARHQKMHECFANAHMLANAAEKASALQRCLRDTPASTTEEVIWPLVAAAVSSARIHLLSRSPQILDVARSGCGEWSEERFVVMVQTGMNRLLGLGSTHTSVTVSRLRLQEDRKNKGTALTCGQECSAKDLALVDSFLNSHEGAIEAGHSEHEAKLVFLKLEYEKFQVGRDGECCIQQRSPIESKESEVEAKGGGEQIPGDKICLMRPYRYLLVQLQAPRDLSKRHLCHHYSNDLELSVQLRGSFFGDPFYAVNITVNAMDGNLPRAPRAMNNTWLTAHNVFVYVASYC